MKKVTVAFNCTLILMALAICRLTVASDKEDAMGVLTSQIGYELGGAKRAIIRSNDVNRFKANTPFQLQDENGKTVFSGTLANWGKNGAVTGGSQISLRSIKRVNIGLGLIIKLTATCLPSPTIYSGVAALNKSH